MGGVELRGPVALFFQLPALALAQIGLEHPRLDAGHEVVAQARDIARAAVHEGVVADLPAQTLGQAVDRLG